MAEVVRGATVRDRLTGKQWDIRAKVVINATGWQGVKLLYPTIPYNTYITVYVLITKTVI